MKTHHHLIPRSRAKDLHIKDIDSPKNIKLIEDYLHRTWHKVFINKTPYEVMALLWKLYSTGDLVFKKTHEYWVLFGHADYLEAIEIVDKDWTPTKDFYDPEKYHGKA